MGLVLCLGVWRCYGDGCGGGAGVDGSLYKSKTPFSPPDGGGYLDLELAGGVRFEVPFELVLAHGQGNAAISGWVMQVGCTHTRAARAGVFMKRG